MMTSSSNSGGAGLKEFGDGDAALFNGTVSIDPRQLAESQEDFEYEFHRLLTEAVSTELEENDHITGFNDTDTNIYDSYLYSTTSPTHDILTPQYTETPPQPPQEVKFEEDPLSAVLNNEQQKSSKTPKKRGRPPLIKFKTVSIQKPAVPLKYPTEREHCHLQMRDRRSDFDFYSPIWISGRGVEREGLCPLCEPSVWLKIKQSAYWYHMNFFHGISAATGRPYKRPISYRYTSEQSSSSAKVDGHCGNCLQWIPLATDYTGEQTSEVVERTVCFTSWFKHAQKCHYRTKEFHIPEDF